MYSIYAMLGMFFLGISLEVTIVLILLLFGIEKREE
jgi:hypothetical protein